MTNLTAADPRPSRGLREIVVMPAAGALFAGSLVEEDGSGNVQNLTGAGTTLVGVALQSATVAGDRIEIAARTTVRLTVAKGSNWAATDVGATVYATDGNVYTLVTTSAQTIGKVVEIESGIGSTSAVVWVYVEGQTHRSL